MLTDFYVGRPGPQPRARVAAARPLPCFLFIVRREIEVYRIFVIGSVYFIISECIYCNCYAVATEPLEYLSGNRVSLLNYPVERDHRQSRATLFFIVYIPCTMIENAILYSDVYSIATDPPLDTNV